MSPPGGSLPLPSVALSARWSAPLPLATAGPVWHRLAPMLAGTLMLGLYLLIV